MSDDQEFCIIHGYQHMRKRDYRDRIPYCAACEGEATCNHWPGQKKGMAAARDVIGIDAIRKAFGPGGGGVSEIRQNFEKQKAAPSSLSGDERG